MENNPASIWEKRVRPGQAEQLFTWNDGSSRDPHALLSFVGMIMVIVVGVFIDHGEWWPLVMLGLLLYLLYCMYFLAYYYNQRYVGNARPRDQRFPDAKAYVRVDASGVDFGVEGLYRHQLPWEGISSFRIIGSSIEIYHGNYRLISIHRTLLTNDEWYQLGKKLSQHCRIQPVA